MKTMLFILSVVFAGAVFAGGGQNMVKNPVIDDDGCLVSLPPAECEYVDTVEGVDIYKCEFDGKVMRFCTN